MLYLDVITYYFKIYSKIYKIKKIIYFLNNIYIIYILNTKPFILLNNVKKDKIKQK